MGKLKFGKVLDFLSFTSCSSSCFCTMITMEGKDELENLPLISIEKGRLPTLKDVVSNNQTLAFQLKPKTVVLKVSMHCNGCARKVEKHISKMEGVTSYKVELETKTVVVTGDIIPFEVLESISKIKNAELWNFTSL